MRRAFLSADTVPYGAKGCGAAVSIHAVSPQLEQRSVIVEFSIPRPPRAARPVRRLVVLAHVFALLFISSGSSSSSLVNSLRASPIAWSISSSFAWIA